MKNVNDRFRFRLLDLFVLMLFVAVLCAWWIDRNHLSSQVELLNLRLSKLLQAQEFADQAAPRKTPNPALTPMEFVSLVANGDDWNKLQAALVAFRTSPARDQAVDGLLRLLDDNDEKVRTRSLAALAQIKSRGDSVVPRIIPLLDDPDANVQWHAANVLGEFSIEAQPGIPALKKKMMQDECEIATYAAIVAKKLDPSIDIGPRLAELVKNPIRENRWRAVMQLPTHVSAETTEALLTVLFATESDAEIRNLIADALNRSRLKMPLD